MSHNILIPFIAKVSVLGYFPLQYERLKEIEQSQIEQYRILNIYIYIYIYIYTLYFIYIIFYYLFYSFILYYIFYIYVITLLTYNLI